MVFLIWHVYGVCALFSFTQPHCLAYTESSHRVSYTDCPYLISSALSVMRFCMAEVKACMFPAESFLENDGIRLKIQNKILYNNDT